MSGAGGTSGPRGERLACGRAVEDVLAQVAAGRASDRDAHQQQCLHCQAALGEYDRLWAPMRELADQQVTAPESIVENALRRIRGAVEHRNYGVLDSGQGRTRIAARVVVVAARETAQAVPGVRIALSKHLADRAGAAGVGTNPGVATDLSGAELSAEVSAGVAGRSTAIEITLAADYGIDLRQLGARVRAEVVSRVRELTDLEPVHVTVIIDNVFE